MNLKRNILLLFFFCESFIVKTQDFPRFFVEKTLRIDCVFSGNREHQIIALDELSSYPHWWGRKHHLSENILKGNGKIEVFDDSSNLLIYTNSFSTLFQEWLSTEEATQTNKSFENVFLVPFPKQKVRIEFTLFDQNGNEKSKLIHFVQPNDVLIHEKGVRNITNFEYIHKAKNVDNAIDVVFVAEGFQEHEMERFIQKAKEAYQEILSYAPFNQFSEYFNFIAVKSSSTDSGVSMPYSNEWKNTAVESHFGTFYSERYLTTNRIKKLHDILAGIPYEHIIILANTPLYGGGGVYNSYTLTATENEFFKPVIVHEFGHSFAGLSDEYFYEDDVLSNFISNSSEPWEKNITTLVDFEHKWKSMLNKGTPIPTPISKSSKYPIGVYEGLKGKKIYISSLDCRMKSNEAEKFCTVCQNAISEVISFLIL